MKKSLKIFFVLSILLILVLSFVSAGFFNKKKITGEAVNPLIDGGCSDADGGLNYYVKGVAQGNFDSLGENYLGLGQVYDFCVQLDENERYPWVNEQFPSNVWNGYEVERCERNCAIYEFSCKDGEIWNIVPKCPGGCINGACVQENQICTDSDKGLNYYAYGLITGPDETGETTPSGDYCWDNGEGVMEGYCDSEGNGGFYSYTCPNGCEDGVCLDKLGEDCSAPFINNQFQDTDGDGCHAGMDSDCGGIEEVDGSGVNCFDGIDNDCDGLVDSSDNDLSCNLNCGDGVCGVYEAFNSSIYYCEKDCMFSYYCIDDDGGLEYDVYGLITGHDELGETNPPADYCWDNGEGIMEGYCTSNGYVDFYPYTCPNGCKDGKCVARTTLRNILDLFNGDYLN